MGGEPALYAPIDAELKKADTPFARAFARERAWLKNDAYLQRLVREPVFGEASGSIRSTSTCAPIGSNGRSSEAARGRCRPMLLASGSRSATSST